eukprot:15481576-Alexandrium_andersonii.AAC.1
MVAWARQATADNQSGSQQLSPAKGPPQGSFGRLSATSKLWKASNSAGKRPQAPKRPPAGRRS